MLWFVKLRIPAGIAEGSKVVAFGRRMGGVALSIGVCFFVVMVREVIEGLESVAGIGVERDSVFFSACDVLEGVERGLVVLLEPHLGECMWLAN